MRICIDPLALSQFSFTGYATYALALLNHLPIVSDREEFVVFVPSLKESWLGSLRSHPNLQLREAPGMRHRFWWKALGVGLAAKKENADVLFIPVTRVPFLRKCPTVTVVHDLGFLSHPTYQLAGSQRKTMYGARMAVEKADRLITVSGEIKRQAVEQYSVPPEKFVVVHLGFDKKVFNDATMTEKDRQDVLARYKLRQPFLLYLGVIQRRKNLEKLLEAYRLLVAENKNVSHDLVLAGKLGWQYDDILKAAKQPVPNGKIILTGAVRQEDLPTLYKLATALILPSVYEGFGLPVVEAMACGTPVLTSDLPVFREIAGEASVHFDPYSTESMVAAIFRVVSDADLRREMRRMGLKQTAAYSWERCAKETLSVLRQCAEARASFNG